MIRLNKMLLLPAAVLVMGLASCEDDDPPMDNFDTSGTYMQDDQMARPAINTVFVGAARKNEFNTTPPSGMDAAFNAQFQSVLTNFGYTTNALGQDKAAFAGLLVKDVLNVRMNGSTTFFDGVLANTLTGRALADDVIDVELTLIFGGPNALSGSPTNPGLISDNVNSNDKPFSASFPYLASPF